MIGQPAFMIAEEVGLRVIEAADKISQFAPDLEASFTFELDDDEFVLTIKRTPEQTSGEQPR